MCWPRDFLRPKRPWRSYGVSEKNQGDLEEQPKSTEHGLSQEWRCTKMRRSRGAKMSEPSAAN